MRSLNLTTYRRLLDRLRLQRLKLVGRRLLILTYHAIVESPLEVHDGCFLAVSTFRRHIEYIRRNFGVVSLNDGLELLRHKAIGGPTLAVTFDDGFQNTYEVAFPILQEFRVPATIFLVTGFVNTDDTLWYCRLNLALSRTREPRLAWNGFSFDLSGSWHRARASLKIQRRLKTFSHPRLLAEVRQIADKLGDDPDRPIGARSPFRMLGREAIAKMGASGLVSFGAHTHSHAILSLVSLEERRHEIEESLLTVEKLTGQPCGLFAYPNGRRQDYDAETIRILRSCGVHAAVTTVGGTNSPTTPLMELRRHEV